MAQVRISEILEQSARLQLRLVAGPDQGADITRVEIATLDALDIAPLDSLVVAMGRDGRKPSPYEVDIAIRHAIARRFSALIFVEDFPLAATAKALATKAGLPIMMAAAGTASELAVIIDRIVRGGATEALARAEYAIAQVSEIAASSPEQPMQAILAAASNALGVSVTVDEDATASWTDRNAVWIGEIPMGRLSAGTSKDAAASIAMPVIASVLSRSLQREIRDRFAPAKSRSDLIVELVFAESSRVDGFAVEAARVGLPLQQSHVVAWLSPTHVSDANQRLPRLVQASIELFTLQLVESRDELWHVALVRDDIVIVCTEEPGGANHQRRLRDMASAVLAHAIVAAGDEWVFTVGLGVPQSSASGLRQSATEARIAAETAIAGGSVGTITAADATGLRRVLLDFYASPLSRDLLNDVLAPLDALDPERATVAVHTLLAYLGHRNSLVRAAKDLNLHPNAVNYRMRWIEQTLQLDLDDPDNRFAVELACRVRLL